MMYIRVPQETVEIKPWEAVLETNPDAKPAKMSFREFATYIWLDDPRGYANERGEQSIVKLRRWQKVIDRFEWAKPGDYIELEDEDYVTLVKIVENPSNRFTQGHTRIALACMCYVDAVLGATKEKPLVLTAVNE